MQQYKFSIIIPHKNIPGLLQRCLDSIPSRDDIQVIIVDDNSNPGKVNFSDFPGLNRRNTEVYFDKTGKGAGCARNVGLEHVKGEWILFADADDYFNYCFSSFLDDYRSSEADIVFTNASSSECQYYFNTDRSLLTNSLVNLNEENKERAEFLFRYHQGVPWSKMIKSSLINRYRIRFDETPISNDTTFAYQTGFVANKILVDKRAIYCVTMRSDSITYTMSATKALVTIEVFSRKFRYLRDRGINLWEYTIPVLMNQFKAANDQDSYKKGLLIMKNYGIEEIDLDKPYLVFEGNKGFCGTQEFRELSASFERNGFSYRLTKFFLSLIRLLNK